MTATPSWPLDPDRDEFTYEMLTNRFLAHDEMLWQTPALALTAQAFLMTIALGENAGAVESAIASLLGFVLMFMSMHLLARHRFLELIEKAKLGELERKLGMEPVSSQSWAWGYSDAPPLGRAYRPAQYTRTHPRYSWYLARTSYPIWQVGLLLFAITDLGVFAYSLGRLLGVGN